MIKKISLPVLVTVMCVMISVVLGLVWLNQQKQIKNLKTQKSETKVTRTDYSATARKTLDWIDQQRNDTGWYILERGCDFEAKTCDTVWDNQEGNKDGLIATWARLNYYHQTKDPKDLEIVKKDIDLFYEKYPNGVDNALWICKITYDMWKSNLFDQTTKDKLERICFESKFDALSENDDYQEWLENKVNRINNSVSTWKTWNGYSLAVRSFDNYFSLATDFLYRYIWKKHNEDFVLAKEYLKLGKKIIEDEKIFVTDNLCLLGLSSIDMYKLGGKDENDLNYAKEVYLSSREKPEMERSFQTPICGLLSKQLFNLSGDIVFLNGFESNNKLMIKNLLDDQKSFSNISGNGGFFISSAGRLGFLYKNIVENGLIVDLIRD